MYIFVPENINMFAPLDISKAFSMLAMLWNNLMAYCREMDDTKNPDKLRSIVADLNIDAWCIKRELRTIRSHQNPDYCAIISWFENGDLLCLVMEFIICLCDKINHSDGDLSVYETALKKLIRATNDRIIMNNDEAMDEFLDSIPDDIDIDTGNIRKITGHRPLYNAMFLDKLYRDLLGEYFDFSESQD